MRARAPPLVPDEVVGLETILAALQWGVVR